MLIQRENALARSVRHSDCLPGVTVARRGDPCRLFVAIPTLRLTKFFSRLSTFYLGVGYLGGKSSVQFSWVGMGYIDIGIAIIHVRRFLSPGAFHVGRGKCM